MEQQLNEITADEDGDENNENERKLSYDIDNLSQEILDDRKQFDKNIILLNNAWKDFEENPDSVNEEALKDSYIVYNESNKYGRDVENRLMINRLFNLWNKTNERRYLNLFLNYFPDNDYQAFIFIKKFFKKPGFVSFTAIKYIKRKCTDIDSLNTRINKMFYRHIKKYLLLPLAPLYMIKNVIKRKFRLSLMKKGFSSYMSYEWIRMMIEDLKKAKNYSLSEKIWWFRRGFRPWRIPQYYITKENYKEVISDRDYCYLHPINNTYVKWINDKVSMRYILEPFKEHLPEYYFHILRRYGNKTDVVPLIDCPEGYEQSYEGILHLLEDKGDLALKMSSGTHGIGFRKLSYRNGIYFMNNKFCHKEDIIKYFDSRTAFYVITNYVNSHRDIKNIYPNSTNTVRIMVINENGISPIIASAFMRIGSSTTGVIDNVGFGGVSASVDLKTGHFYNGEQNIEHIIYECKVHPDTGINIDGILPHWNTILEKIPLMCCFIPQLEFMGFDVAITNSGFIVLEINVHQDLHRFPYYSPEVKDYFFRKLEEKQRRYSYRYKRL